MLHAKIVQRFFNLIALVSFIFSLFTLYEQVFMAFLLIQNFFGPQKCKRITVYSFINTLLL